MILTLQLLIGLASTWAATDEQVAAATQAIRDTFGTRHLQNTSCSFVLPEFDRGGPLTKKHPQLVQQLNEQCSKLHVTRYTTEWNLGYWFLTEELAGRTYGGKGACAETLVTTRSLQLRQLLPCVMIDSHSTRDLGPLEHAAIPACSTHHLHRGHLSCRRRDRTR